MQTRKFIKGDDEYEFYFDIKAALDIEKKENKNVLKDIEKLSEEPSLTLIDEAARVWMGCSLEEAYDAGLNMQDVIAIVGAMITGDKLDMPGLKSVGGKGQGFTTPSATTPQTGLQDGTSSDEDNYTPVFPDE